MLAGSYHNGFAPRDGVPLYPELWRGCVGAWAPCLGPTGLTLRDWSGFQRHGTLTNMVPGEDWVLTGGRYALDFGDTNDTVTFATPAISVWTIAMWINASSFTSVMSAYFQSGLELTNNNGTGSPTNRVSVARPGLYNPIGTSQTALLTNTWYHIAATMSPTLICQLFLNGRLDSASLNYATRNVTLNTTGAISGTVFSRSMSGQIDDVRLYDRVLTEQELRTLASRRGIAYDLAPRRRGGVFTAGGFKAYWAARKAAILGGGLQ